MLAKLGLDAAETRPPKIGKNVLQTSANCDDCASSIPKDGPKFVPEVVRHAERAARMAAIEHDGHDLMELLTKRQRRISGQEKEFLQP